MPTTQPQQTVADRLTELRAELDARGVTGLLIPRADRHLGEYPPDADGRLAAMTGFGGSAGLAIVLKDRAALFVDGRYELAAAAATADLPIDVVKLRETRPTAWLREALSAGDALAYDPWLHAESELQPFITATRAVGAAFVPLSPNPVDAVWRGRPAFPAETVRPHPERFAGRSAAAKRAEAAEALRADGLAAAALTAPDSLAWLLNIRGDDIPMVPAPLAFGLLHDDGSVALFTSPEKFGETARAHLGEAVTIEPWEAFEPALERLAGRRVAVDRARAPAAVAERLRAAGAEPTPRIDPCLGPRARKTQAEQDGARAAHRRDGAALCSFLAWLSAVGADGAGDEYAVSQKLGAFRRTVAGPLAEADGAALMGDSFEAIVGFAANGAIVHYRVEPGGAAPLADGGLLLVDSGAQYLDGTTDVTRTLVVGSGPAGDPAARAAATRVLQGVIAVSMLRFPAKTKGREIEAFGRAPLWRAGLDFDHGLGHGIGSYLSVHEGPAGLSKRSETDMEPGVIVSNEPGFYLTGRFGVRLENLVMVQPARPDADTGVDSGQRPLYGFETLTLAPFDRRLIDPELLSGAERGWLDDYHARVLAEIGPLLDADARAWLEQACAPL